MRRRTLLVGIAGLGLCGCVEIQSDDEDPRGADGGGPNGPGSDDSDGGDADGEETGDGGDTGDEETGDGGDTGDEETDEEFYESGTIEIVIDGSPVDLSADRFQAEHNPDHDIRFHFHEGDDEWHMEEERVTFGQAIDLIPFFSYDRQDGAHVVTYDDETYDGSDSSTEIEFRVDGGAVDPTDYDLQDGDHLAMEISTSG